MSFVILFAFLVSFLSIVVDEQKQIKSVTPQILIIWSW